jgi:hypothetical protein
LNQGPEGDRDQQREQEQLGQAPKAKSQIGKQTRKEQLQQGGPADGDFQLRTLRRIGHILSLSLGTGPCKVFRGLNASLAGV